METWICKACEWLGTGNEKCKCRNTANVPKSEQTVLSTSEPTDWRTYKIEDCHKDCQHGYQWSSHVSECREYAKLKTENTSATKHDSAKPDLSMLPYSSLTQIVLVMEFGKKKYGRDNWRKGMNWTRLSSAALRHLFAWIGGEDKDPESELSHLAHAGCNILFLLEFLLTKPELDDRFKADVSNKKP